MLEKLATFITKDDSDSNSPLRINPLQLLGTIQAMKGNSQPLLYVCLTLNGREIDAIYGGHGSHPQFHH